MVKYRGVMKTENDYQLKKLLEISHKLNMLSKDITNILQRGKTDENNH